MILHRPRRRSTPKPKNNRNARDVLFRVIECLLRRSDVRSKNARVMRNLWLDVTNSRKSRPTTLGIHILYIKVFWIDFSNFVRRNIFREFILTLKYVYFGFPKDNDVTKKDFIISLT